MANITQQQLKSWWKSRTLGVNGIVILVAILGYFAGPESPVEFNAEVLGWITATMAVLNIGLRFLTDSPIVVRKPK